MLCDLVLETPKKTRQQVKLETPPVKLHAKRKRVNHCCLDTANDRHLKICRKGVSSCAQCAYLARPGFFNKLTAMQDPGAAEGTVSGIFWLKAGIAEDGGWGLGCTACAHAKIASPWAQGVAGRKPPLKPYALLRHAQTQLHIRAAALFLKVPGCKLVNAPSMDEFRKALEQLAAQGASIRRLQGRGCSSDKAVLLKWCLVEATRQINREFLAKAKTIALCRDARRQRLVIRFGAANDSMEVRRGVLGVARDQGDKAGDIVKATRAVIKSLCVENSDPPRHYKGPAPTFNKQLFSHVCDHIEIVVSDAAANELLAGEIGRGRRSKELETGKGSLTKLLTPNLKLLTRDASHSFRRTAGLTMGGCYLSLVPDSMC